jgi:predicted PurR-regulated permease PerM
MSKEYDLTRNDLIYRAHDPSGGHTAEEDNAKGPLLPVYLKAILLFIGIIAFFVVLYIAQGILIPLVFAVFIAIMLHPFVSFLVRRKINRVVAILIALLMTFIIVSAFGALIISQVSRFADSWPLLVEKFTSLTNSNITRASRYFDINPQDIHNWITKTSTGLFQAGSIAIGQTLVKFGSWIVVLLLVPVYTFLILFYHPLLIDFIRKLSGSRNQKKVNEIVKQTKTVVQRYLTGLVIEAFIVAILNSAGLLMLGIDYAILLGIVGALLNVIPYIGGIIAVALPMLVALVTKSSGWYPFYVMAVYYFIQLIDNNFIVPKIVASKVKINALFSIIVVIVGNALWGVPGMFLSIPLLAIVKLVFDNIEPLKPWGFLLGDTMPPLLLIKPIFKKTIYSKS